jgi:hypothetical protein
MLANSDIRGNVKPTEFRLAINDAVNEITEEYFYEVNRLLNRQNKGFINGGIENIPDRIREKILHFLVEDQLLVYAEPYFNLPNDLRYIDSVFYNDKANVEFCKDNRNFRQLSYSKDTKPTLNYPIGLQVGTKIKIGPSVINDKVTVSYLRNPKIANWSYVVVDGSEIFNPSSPSFQDVDLHSSEFNNLVLKTLHRFGVNLKEEDLVRNASAEENQDISNKNNS